MPAYVTITFTKDLTNVSVIDEVIDEPCKDIDGKEYTDRNVSKDDVVHLKAEQNQNDSLGEISITSIDPKTKKEETGSFELPDFNNSFSFPRGS